MKSLEWKKTHPSFFPEPRYLEWQRKNYFFTNISDPLHCAGKIIIQFSCRSSTVVIFRSSIIEFCHKNNRITSQEVQHKTRVGREKEREWERDWGNWTCKRMFEVNRSEISQHIMYRTTFSLLSHNRSLCLWRKLKKFCLLIWMLWEIW